MLLQWILPESVRKEEGITEEIVLTLDLEVGVVTHHVWKVKRHLMQKNNVRTTQRLGRVCAIADQQRIWTGWSTQNLERIAGNEAARWIGSDEQGLAKSLDFII